MSETGVVEVGSMTPGPMSVGRSSPADDLAAARRVAGINHILLATMHPVPRSLRVRLTMPDPVRVGCRRRLGRTAQAPRSTAFRALTPGVATHGIGDDSRSSGPAAFEHSIDRGECRDSHSYRVCRRGFVR